MDCAACGHENLEGARFCANCGVTLTRVDPGDPLIGKLVGGRYKVIRVMGEGGMGIVYEAEQSMGSTVRKVAVKTLHTELSRDPSVTARFHRECGTVAQLEHPNTIKVYDFGSMDDGTLYIAMEFLAGKPLDRVIAETGSMQPRRVLHLLQQIAGSLEEAHKKGIVHRDLKPENVFVIERAGEKDVVKLLDFGIAARTESASAEREAKLTQQGMVLGTPPYMSPEQFTGKALDRRSDIYSLGIMAYEMLTGRLPFDAVTPWQWATEHMTAQPKPFEDSPQASAIPLGMRAAILRSLSKDRDQRFATVTEFVEALSLPASSPRTDAIVAPAEPAYYATAAMEAAPNFSAPAGPAPTAAMPAQAVAVTAASPAAPQNRMWLLAGGGFVVLAAGAAFALSGSKDSKKTESSAIAFAPPASHEHTKPTSVSTVVSAPEPVASESVEPEPETKPERTEPKARPAVAKPATSAAKPAPVTGDPCARCLAAAGSGDFSSVQSALKSCSDPAKQQACQARAKAGAGAKIRGVAAGGDCTSAKALLNAAVAAGFGSGLERALGSCK